MEKKKNHRFLVSCREKPGAFQRAAEVLPVWLSLTSRRDHMSSRSRENQCQGAAANKQLGGKIRLQGDIQGR